MNRVIRVLLIVGLAVACMGLAPDVPDVEFSEELLEAALEQFMYGGESRSHHYPTRWEGIAIGMMEVWRTANPSNSLLANLLFWPALSEYTSSLSTDPFGLSVIGAAPKVSSFSNLFSDFIVVTGSAFVTSTRRIDGLESELETLQSRIVALDATPQQATSSSCDCQEALAALESRIAALEARPQQVVTSSSSGDYDEWLEDLADWTERELNHIWDYVNGLNDRLNRAGIY
jgi:hypothetical protein